MSETPDQARTRRRWITLAELVAVAGVLIAALGLWNSWSERRTAEAERSRGEQAEARQRARFTLRSEVSGNAVVLKGDDAHELGDVRVAFPTALGVAPKDAVDHRIDADWIAGALLKATDGGPDERTGRLPVLVTYDYLVDDKRQSATATYDMVWRTGGRFLRGRSLELVDFRLRRAGGDQRVLDGLWSSPKR